MALLRRTFAATIRPTAPRRQATLGDCFARARAHRGGSPARVCEIGFGVAAELVRARLGTRGAASRARRRHRRHVRAAARAAVPDRVHASASTSACSRRPRASARSTCAGRRRAPARGRHAARPGSSTCSWRRCCPRASACTSRTSRATRTTGEREGSRRRPCSRCATCSVGARGDELPNGITRPTRRWPATATMPSAR